MLRSPSKKPGPERRKAVEGAGWKVSGRYVDSEGMVDRSNEKELGRVWENNDREYCQGCNCRVNTDQMGMECGGCKRWYHAKCEKLSKKEYEKICEIDEKIIWHCGECGEILPLVLKENRRLHKEIEIVKKEMSEIKELMRVAKGSETSGNFEKLISEKIKDFQQEHEIKKEEMNKKNDRFQEKLQAIENKIKAQLENCMEEIRGTRNEQARLRKENEKMETEVNENIDKLDKKIEENSWQTKKEMDGKLETRVREFKQDTVESEGSKKCIASLKEELELIKKGYKRDPLEPEGDRRIVRDIQEQVEQLEKERRKNNLMIFNLKESNKGAPKERYEYDEEKCRELFRMLGTMEIGIETVVRIGKPTPNRDRPLLIKLTQVRDTKLIMQAKSRLKTLDGFSKVFVERDLTVAEREQNKELRRELYEKRDIGNAWYIIRGGKVVEVEDAVGERMGRRGGTGYTGRGGRGVGQRWRGRGGGQVQSSSTSVGVNRQQSRERATQRTPDNDDN